MHINERNLARKSHLNGPHRKVQSNQSAMYRQIFLFALLAAATVLVFSDERTKIIEANLEDIDETYTDAESKLDLTEYEDPDESVTDITSFFLQLIGSPLKDIAVKLLRGVAAFIALLIVGLSAVSYNV